MLDQILGARMTDADAHPPVIVADMRGDRAQAIVSGDAAADLDPHLAGRQLDLVVEHGDVGRRELIELRRLGDGAAGFVHECPRKKQQRALAAERSFAGDAGKAPAPRPDAVALGDGLQRQEADIVAVADIACSRIAEPHQEQHERRPMRERNLTSSRRRRRRAQHPRRRQGQHRARPERHRGRR